MNGLVRILGVSLLLTHALSLAQEPPAPAQAPTVSLTTRLVYVDVVVRDSHGQIVHGLTQQDFKVQEDGKPQAIAFFEAHTYDAAAAAPTATPAPPPGQLTFSNVASPGTVSGSINILLFDLLNTPGSDQVYARRQMLKFLRDLPPGQRVALFVLTTQLRMLQGFTGNSDLLSSAAKMLDPKDFRILRSQAQQEHDADYLQALAESMSGRDPGDSLGHAIKDLAQEDAINADNRARLTLSALAELARATSGYPGRKNLMWLSASFPLAVGAWMEYNPEATGDLVHSTADLMSQRETANLMATAQIAIYPISVLGTQLDNIGAESRGGAETEQVTNVAPLGRRLGTDRPGQFTGQTQQSYASDDLARQTGGKAFYDSNDLAGALRQSFQEGSNYYSLAYYPQNPDWNGKFRQIRVDLARKGATLTYRRGYFALPDALASADPGKELNVALQPETPESTMLRLKAAVELPGDGHPMLTVTANIDAANVEFTTDAAGHHRAKLLVLLVAFPDGPKLPEEPPQNSGTLNIDLDAARYQTVLERGIGFQQALTLKPGKYRLRLGVSDVSNHHLGTLDMPIDLSALSTNAH